MRYDGPNKQLGNALMADIQSDSKVTTKGGVLIRQIDVPFMFWPIYLISC